MAKGIYVGVDNVARKVKKMFAGVDGVARKVKKAYVGVNNVTRQFFSSVVHLYNAGDLCSSLTGGWSHKTGNLVLSSKVTGWEGAPTMTKASDHLLIYMKDLSYEFRSDYNYVGSWYTSNAINLDNYNKVRMVCDIQLGDAYATKSNMESLDHVRVSVSSNRYTDDYKVRKSITFNNWKSNGENIIEVDVSSLTGDYYIIIDMRRSYLNLTDGDESATLKIKEVYLS